MKKENWLIALAAGTGAALLTHRLLSSDIPDGATPLQNFDKIRYLGLWNEIARLPNSIEKGIKHLTEKYSLNDDGTIKVVTRGYNTAKNKWREATGKIKFNGPEKTGMLKVSYFGPLYAAYNVLDVDAGYKYALVSGSGLDYLWILSKETDVPFNVRVQFIEKAKAIGFDVSKLEWMV
jgi:apolipoprotein D and lipocalin family protein